MVDYNKLPSNNPAIGNSTREPEQLSVPQDRSDVKIKTKQTKSIEKKKLFINGDAQIVKDFLIKDALPSFKAWLFTNGVRVAEAFIFGESRYSGVNTKSSNTSYYKDYTQPKVIQTSNKNNVRGYNLENILFENDAESSGREKAATALRLLDDRISEYGAASVGYFLDMTNNNPVKTDWNYGWRDLSDAAIRETYNGCVLIFPDPIPLVTQ